MIVSISGFDSVIDAIRSPTARGIGDPIRSLAAAISEPGRPRRMPERRSLLDPGDRLQQHGEHPVAVDAGQRQGDLGLDEAELHAEVVPRPPGLQRQVLLAAGQRVQGGR